MRELIAAIAVALMMIVTAADAKGIRIPRFKAPAMRSMPKAPKAVPKAPPAKPVPKANTAKSAPIGSRGVEPSSDVGSDFVTGAIGGAAGAVAGAVLFDAMTAEPDAAEQKQQNEDAEK